MLFSMMGKQIPLVFLNPLFHVSTPVGKQQQAAVCHLTNRIFDAAEVAFLKTYETVLSLGVCVCVRGRMLSYTTEWFHLCN